LEFTPGFWQNVTRVSPSEAHTPDYSPERENIPPLIRICKGRVSHF